MTTCRDIVRTALRRLGELSPGAEPTTEQGNDALASLSGLYFEMVEGGTFGSLTPVIADADYEAAEGERVLSSGFSATLPTTVMDVWTGKTRAPADLALIEVVTSGEEPEISVYDAHRGEWVALSGLSLASDAPLAGRGIDGLASLLAKRMADEYGLPVSIQTEQAAGRFMSAIALKRTTRTVETAYF